jgi:hypothetical protein
MTHRPSTRLLGSAVVLVILSACYASDSADAYDASASSICTGLSLGPCCATAGCAWIESHHGCFATTEICEYHGTPRSECEPPRRCVTVRQTFATDYCGGTRTEGGTIGVCVPPGWPEPYDDVAPTLPRPCYDRDRFRCDRSSGQECCAETLECYRPELDEDRCATPP